MGFMLGIVVWVEAVVPAVLEALAVMLLAVVVPVFVTAVVVGLFPDTTVRPLLPVVPPETD